MLLSRSGQYVKGLGTPSRYLARTISWNAYKVLICVVKVEITPQKVALLGSTVFAEVLGYQLQSKRPMPLYR